MTTELLLSPWSTPTNDCLPCSLHVLHMISFRFAPHYEHFRSSTTHTASLTYIVWKIMNHFLSTSFPVTLDFRWSIICLCKTVSESLFYTGNVYFSEWSAIVQIKETPFPWFTVENSEILTSALVDFCEFYPLPVPRIISKRWESHCSSCHPWRMTSVKPFRVLHPEQWDPDIYRLSISFLSLKRVHDIWALTMSIVVWIFHGS